MNRTQIIVAAVIAVGIWVVFGQDEFVRLRYQDLSFQSVAGVLTPLFVTALFIERAIEVYVGVSREPDKQGKLKALEGMKSEEKRAAEAEVVAFKQGTAKRASVLGFLLGLGVAASGMRSLWPLLDPQCIVPDAVQFRVFNLVDVLVTAGLLAGGSAGIHKMLAPLQDWFEAKRGQG